MSAWTFTRSSKELLPLCLHRVSWMHDLIDLHNGHKVVLFVFCFLVGCKRFVWPLKNLQNKSPYIFLSEVLHCVLVIVFWMQTFGQLKQKHRLVLLTIMYYWCCVQLTGIDQLCVKLCGHTKLRCRVIFPLLLVIITLYWLHHRFICIMIRWKCVVCGKTDNKSSPK